MVIGIGWSCIYSYYTIKNFVLNLNAPNGRSTISSGDLVEGHISFDLTKETKITSITVELRGRAHVHWSSGGGKNKRNISSKVDFFKLKSVVLQDNGSMRPPRLLHPGTHVYPFACQLPDFPISFHGVNGEITYNLTVGINRPWHVSKDFVTELKFVKHIDSNQPELGCREKSLCPWYYTHPSIHPSIHPSMEIIMILNTVSSLLGETVKIMCDINNASSRTATLKVKLQQKQAFYAHDKAYKRIVFKNLAFLTAQPISANTSDVHTELMLTIPSSVSHSISNCSILEVDYMIEVGKTDSSYNMLENIHSQIFRLRLFIHPAIHFLPLILCRVARGVAEAYPPILARSRGHPGQVTSSSQG
uniref:Arrestin C-terminal-like domain-containing protein n=1 Tax=Mola mola TaxID=94237 RepID=A0A3Q3X732_MOLML